MKREQKPFVVEVKRGGRRSSFLGLMDKAEPMSDAIRRAERALFAGVPSEEQPPKPPVSEPAGRILRSLVEPQPVEVQQAIDLAPRRRGRKPGSKNKVKTIVVPVQMRAPVVAGASEPLRVDAVAAFADPPAARSGHATDIAEPPPYRDSGPIHEELPATSAAMSDHGPGEGILDDVAPGHSNGLGRKRLRERSSILARYVFETEPTPGERWKRPTRRVERRRKALTA